MRSGASVVRSLNRSYAASFEMNATSFPSPQRYGPPRHVRVMKPNLTRMGVGLVAVALVGGVVAAPDRREKPDRPYVSITWAGQRWVIPAGARVAPRDPVFQRRAAAA